MAFHKIGKHVLISGGVHIEYARNIELGDNVSIGSYAILNGSSRKHKQSIMVGENTQIYQFTVFNTYGGYIKIGRNCTVNPFCVLYGHGGLDIGDDVHIASKTTIIPANHGIENTDIPMWRQPETAKGIRIEDDVWIGTNVSIVDGVTSGKGVVIGAGSVVTENIPEYSIAVGIPAKIIRKRK